MRAFLFLILSVLAGLIPEALCAMETHPSSQPAAPRVWRVSLENAPGHVQVKEVRNFARRFEALSKGRVTVQIYDSAKLYRDIDLPRALSNDRVDMGVPGVWQLDRYETGFGIFLLPLFYGRDPDVNHEIVDGPLGQALADALERRLDVVVVGRWIDLGPAHIFTFRKPIRVPGDFAGLRLRVAGGQANEMRLRAMGADPVRIAWPDLAGAIDGGLMDGLLTSYVTIQSSSFADRIRYVYEDSAYFPQYVPLVSSAAWQRLGPELQHALFQAWEEGVADAREAAAAAQIEARRQLVERGLTVIRPTGAELAVNRARLEAGQEDMIAATRVQSAIVSGLQLHLNGVEADP